MLCNRLPFEGRLDIVSGPHQRWYFIPACFVACAFAAASFLIGIHWGLPTRAADRYLFGSQTPWTGAKIISLAPAESDERGADVDANPIDRSKGDVILNATDSQRAEIIRRYRLFSYQPDEMITFKSLSRLRQNHGDPRLYQYGGLWIYPVGALLKAASLVGYVDLRSDQAFYIDHPETFGRFYVVARFYSACFGILGAAAVFFLIRRLTGCNVLVPMIGTMCFAMMPVVINLAHEAKPHLPATTLILFAVLAAARYVETGKRKWAIMTGLLCGAAFGMVISALVAFAIPFVMIFLRSDASRARMTSLGLALTAGVIVFAVTNPFVLINIIAHPERFHSNIQNSTNMYAAHLGGLGNAVWLTIAGASPVIVLFGVLGLLSSFRPRSFRTRIREGYALLFAPVALSTAIFVLLAAGKPPEYARFGLPLDVALLIVAFVPLGLLAPAPLRVLIAIALLFSMIFPAWDYWRGFVRDCRPITSRLATAEQLALSGGGKQIAIRLESEPAPYDLPPVDLFRDRLVLTRSGATIVRDFDRSLTPISWADVQFQLRNFDSSSRPSSTTAVSSKP